MFGGIQMPLWILCIICMIAQFVDAIAGGGGIISLPAIAMYGSSMIMALATNKMGAMFGSVSSAITFIKKGTVDIHLVKYWVPFTMMGAILGVQTVLLMDPAILNVVVTILLIVMCGYTLLKKQFGKDSTFIGKTRRTIIIGAIIAFVMGFYDGFFGPGVGSFLIFLFVRFIGFDFITGAGYGKTLNAISNVTSFVIFAIHGAVNYPLGLILAVFMMVGAVLGTKCVLIKGSNLVKPVFIIVSLCLVCKIVLAGM